VESEAILQEIATQVRTCTRCPLSLSRKLAVPGEGPASAEILLIGEGPGFYENEQGRPFVGAAGKFLDELLQKAGVNRKSVFITNVVKCRPPGNRDPLPEELSACNSFLERQIEAINPLIIVTLGRYSMSKFMYNARISEVHGKPVWIRSRLIVPMFHPAAALHQPSLKTSVERDFSRLPEWIEQARKNGKLAQTGPPAQLTEAQPSGQRPQASAVPPRQASLLDAAAEPAVAPADADDENQTSKKATPTQLSLF
jgi:DNA polymerase